MGCGIEPRKIDIAGAESFHSLEGNMCGIARRGADALPGSKATSRAKGSHRKLGGLASGRQMLRERDGPHREGEERAARLAAILVGESPTSIGVQSML